MPFSFPVIIGKKIESLISSLIPGPLSMTEILQTVEFFSPSIISPWEILVTILISGEEVSDSNKASLAFLVKFRMLFSIK